MPNRVGRPTDNPKKRRESFRLSDEDVEKLKVCSTQMKMSKTEIVRKAIDRTYRELHERSQGE